MWMTMRPGVTIFAIFPRVQDHFHPERIKETLAQELVEGLSWGDLHDAPQGVHAPLQ
jgi:hypothetical protein